VDFNLSASEQTNGNWSDSARRVHTRMTAGVACATTICALIVTNAPRTDAGCVAVTSARSTTGPRLTLVVLHLAAATAAPALQQQQQQQLCGG